MRNNIIEKLDRTIENGIDSEQSVVYFLVESYKLIEQENRLADFELIRFYRNWVCHSILVKDSQKVFEEVYILIRAQKYLNLEERGKDEMPAFPELIDDTVSAAFEKYSFKRLKEEIEMFSKKFLSGNTPNWETFVRRLSEVLINVPLIIKKDKDEIFRFEVIEITKQETSNGLTVQITFPGGWIRTTGGMFFEL
ncbi:MAG: hypothetical protein RLY47_602 [Candidatus Parcubacteria bacterium]|jgi:hypothetical protein